MTINSDLLRAIRGPLLLIALGLLFTEDYFGPVSFSKTWPVLLIVYGVLVLLERMVVREGAGATPGGSR